MARTLNSKETESDNTIENNITKKETQSTLFGNDKNDINDNKGSSNKKK